MLMKGVKEGNHNEVLYKPYCTKVWVDVALRFWRYADFKLDYMLAKECKYIVRLRDVFLNKDCVVFEQKRYQMDLREYLRKHRDFRKLNEILL